jgi:hypothetical protein
MKLTATGIKKIFREIYSEPNGGGLSWGRVAATFTVLASIVWLSRVLYLTHSLPGNMTDIAAFMVSPYVANKVTTAAQAFSPNPISAPLAPAVVPPPMVPPPPAS